MFNSFEKLLKGFGETTGSPEPTKEEPQISEKKQPEEEPTKKPAPKKRAPKKTAPKKEPEPTEGKEINLDDVLAGNEALISEIKKAETLSPEEAKKIIKEKERLEAEKAKLEEAIRELTRLSQQNLDEPDLNLERFEPTEVATNKVFKILDNGRFDLLVELGYVDEKLIQSIKTLSEEKNKIKDRELINKINQRIDFTKEKILEKALSDKKIKETIQEKEQDLLQEISGGEIQDEANEYLAKELERSLQNEETKRVFDKLNEVTKRIKEIERTLDREDLPEILAQIEEERKRLEAEKERLEDERIMRGVDSKIKLLERETKTSINTLKKVLKSVLPTEEVENIFSEEGMKKMREGDTYFIEETRAAIKRGILFYEGEISPEKIIPAGLKDPQLAENKSDRRKAIYERSRFRYYFSYFKNEFPNSRAQMIIYEEDRAQGTDTLGTIERKLKEAEENFVSLENLFGKSTQKGSLQETILKRARTSEEELIKLREKITETEAERVKKDKKFKEEVQEKTNEVLKNATLIIPTTKNQTAIVLEEQITGRGPNKGKKNIYIKSITLVDGKSLPRPIGKFEDSKYGKFFVGKIVSEKEPHFGVLMEGIENKKRE